MFFLVKFTYLEQQGTVGSEGGVLGHFGVKFFYWPLWPRAS